MNLDKEISKIWERISLLSLEVDKLLKELKR